MDDIPENMIHTVMGCVLIVFGRFGRFGRLQGSRNLMTSSAGKHSPRLRLIDAKYVIICYVGLATLIQVFGRAGLLMLVSDSPQRAQLLYCKAPNHSTVFPCPTCLVSQTGSDGGHLGDENFAIYSQMRSRENQDRVQRELGMLPKGSAEAKELSTKTGVNAKDPESPRAPVTDLITTGESARVVVAEILHLDPLVDFVKYSGSDREVNADACKSHGKQHHAWSAALKNLDVTVAVKRTTDVLADSVISLHFRLLRLRSQNHLGFINRVRGHSLSYSLVSNLPLLRRPPGEAEKPTA